jgi:hypothetical protein
MSTLQAGLNAAAARSPVVLNVLGGAENETLCQAMAQNNRAAYVWVAGSNAQLLDPTHEPSCSAPNILRVAPYNQISGQFLSSSNYGGSVRLAAPGFNVPVLGPQGRALRMSGGSVAAALAGAQLAVFARENPSLAGGDLITQFLAKKTRVESSFAPYVQDGRVLEDNGL